MALIPDLLTSLITIILILNPLHKATISYHPIYALISSFCLFALYTNCAWLNWLVPYSNEVNFAGRDAWEKLCLAELAMESLVALMWFVMFVLACVATRRWDVGRRKCGNESIKMARVGGEESV